MVSATKAALEDALFISATLQWSSRILCTLAAYPGALKHVSNTHPWLLLLQSLLSEGSESCGRERWNIHNGWLLPPALPTTVYCLIYAARLGLILALCALPCTSVHRGKHYLERCTSTWKGAALAR